MRLHTKQWLSYADFALASLMWTVLVCQHAAGWRFRLMTEHRISALKVLPRDIILQLLPSNTFHKIRQGRQYIRIASAQGFSNLWTRLTVRNKLSIMHLTEIMTCFSRHMIFPLCSSIFLLLNCWFPLSELIVLSNYLKIWCPQGHETYHLPKEYIIQITADH